MTHPTAHRILIEHDEAALLRNELDEARLNLTSLLGFTVQRNTVADDVDALRDQIDELTEQMAILCQRQDDAERVVGDWPTQRQALWNQVVLARGDAARAEGGVRGLGKVVSQGLRRIEEAVGLEAAS